MSVGANLCRSCGHPIAGHDPRKGCTASVRYPGITHDVPCLYHLTAEEARP